MHDDKKALYYLKIAADSNNPLAQYLYGRCEMFRNINKSLYYFLLSAQNGKIESIFTYAFIKHEGLLIKRNIFEAIHFYKEGSSFNDQYSKNNLGIIKMDLEMISKKFNVPHFIVLVLI